MLLIPNIREITLWEPYDIDTIKLPGMIDPYTQKTLRARICYTDGPEKRSRRAEEKQAALWGLRVVVEWLNQFEMSMIQIQGPDKYAGRVLVNWYGNGDTKNSLAEWSLDNGLVKPYFGRLKPRWTDEELQDTLDNAIRETERLRKKRNA